jgi:hypothetical protein
VSRSVCAARPDCPRTNSSHERAQSERVVLPVLLPALSLENRGQTRVSAPGAHLQVPGKVPQGSIRASTRPVASDAPGRPASARPASLCLHLESVRRRVRTGGLMSEGLRVLGLEWALCHFGPRRDGRAGPQGPALLRARPVEKWVGTWDQIRFGISLLCW